MTKNEAAYLLHPPLLHNYRTTCIFFKNYNFVCHNYYIALKTVMHTLLGYYFLVLAYYYSKILSRPVSIYSRYIFYGT